MNKLKQVSLMRLERNVSQEIIIVRKNLIFYTRPKQTNSSFALIVEDDTRIQHVSLVH